MATRWMSLYQGTPAEHALEPELAKLGIPYRWQHPVWAARAFLDFALPTVMLAIEVDDKGHYQPAKKKKDAERTERLGKYGWTVIRVPNETILDDAAGWVRRVLVPKLKEMRDGHSD